MNKPYAGKFERSLVTIDFCHPRISPPVGEHSRIVIAEYIDVGPMNKVVCENVLVAAFVQWSDHSNIWRRKVVLNTNNMAQFFKVNFQNLFIGKCYITVIKVAI